MKERIGGSEYVLMQVLVDIGTTGNVVETLAAALKEFVEARPMDYSAHDVMFTTGADPLKLGLLVFYQFAHTGESLSVQCDLPSLLQPRVTQDSMH